jgi:AcrR family transcriptional regulator
MTHRTKSAPGRRTRQRILDATLALYNERGEPQVSTSLIATELGISAGNLHYHFRRKDALSAALLDRFATEFDAVLPPAGWRADHAEDAWLLLHLLLETVWRYRFLFRDLSGVMTRDRRAARRLADVFGRASALAWWSRGPWRRPPPRSMPWRKTSPSSHCTGSPSRRSGIRGRIQGGPEWPAAHTRC